MNLPHLTGRTHFPLEFLKYSGLHLHVGPDIKAVHLVPRSGWAQVFSHDILPNLTTSISCFGQPSKIPIYLRTNTVLIMILLKIILTALLRWHTDTFTVSQIIFNASTAWETRSLASEGYLRPCTCVYACTNSTIFIFFIFRTLHCKRRMNLNIY